MYRHGGSFLENCLIHSHLLVSGVGSRLLSVLVISRQSFDLEAFWMLVSDRKAAAKLLGNSLAQTNGAMADPNEETRHISWKTITDDW